MIKLAQDGEEEVESLQSWNCLTLQEIFSIYRVWFTNLLLILGIKSLNFMDKTSSSLSRINLQRNKGFGNWEIR